MLIFLIDIFMILHHKSMKRHHHRELNKGCTELIWLTEALFFCFFCVLKLTQKYLGVVVPQEQCCLVVWWSSPIL